MVLEPVADVLLVERRRGVARGPAAGRPEPGGVGGEDLVGQHQLVAVAAELELGVGEQDAAPGRVLGAPPVDLQGQVAEAAGQVAPEGLGDLGLRDVLVVAGGRPWWPG